MRDRVVAPWGSTLAERIAFHSVQAPSGCIIWTGARYEFGYGLINVNGRSRGAHRVNWELQVGPIPDGKQLDHLCRRPACIKPEHLQPVDAQTNVLRGTAPGARRVRTGACLHGHPSAEHGYEYKGRTFCRVCREANVAAYHARRRAKRDAPMARLLALRDRLSG